MLEGNYVYDSDAHVMMSPRMWQDLPAGMCHRRPRAVSVADDDGLGGWNSAWFIEDQITPRHWGPGSQPANTPASTDGAFSGNDLLSLPIPLGSRDLSDPELRVQDLNRLHIDTSVMYPSTLYARMTDDPELEAALYRSYNRYVGKACQHNPKRLKWGGLIPFRDPVQACQAIHEMRQLGASAAVCFGTVGDRLLSDVAFSPVLDELARVDLPLSIHFGMSYPPYRELSRTTFSGQFIGMTLPVFLALYGVIGGGLADRHPDQKFGFLEFSSEWLLYALPRMELFRKQALRRGHPLPTDMPQREVTEYFRSGNLFVTCEGEDAFLGQEIELIGEDRLMYASDMPHPELREEAAEEILERADITPQQKRKLLCDNVTRYYGEP